MLGAATCWPRRRWQFRRRAGRHRRTVLDAEVVFARGGVEPPGVGATDQAFVDALRAQSPGKSIGVYPGNYPATGDFENRAVFPATMFDGVGDRRRTNSGDGRELPEHQDHSRRLLSGRGGCCLRHLRRHPRRRARPCRRVGALRQAVRGAAVQIRCTRREHLTVVRGKSLDLCAPADNVCDGSPASLLGSLAHVTYPYNGLVDAAGGRRRGRIA